MIARIAALALMAACLHPAHGVQLTTATEFGPPTIRLKPSEVLNVTRTCTVSLQAGESLLTVPLAKLGVAPADVWLEVAPADRVTVVAMETSPDAPGAALWRLRVARDVHARVSVTYPVKGLSWAIEYVATLAQDGGLDLQGSLRVTNGLGRDLEDATLGGDGFRVELSLAGGETVIRELPDLGGRVRGESVERSIVYDNAVHGDSAVELLTFRSGRTVRISGMDLPIVGRLFGVTGPVPAGSVRIYSAPIAGGELIATGSIPYTPAGEPIELKLGPASGIQVTRTRAQATEVNKRLDASNKIAAYDLQETWKLAVRNLREAPVELLVREHHEGIWEMEEASEEYEREDAETLVFRLTLQPGEKRELSYRIRHVNRQP